MILLISKTERVISKQATKNNQLVKIVIYVISCHIIEIKIIIFYNKHLDCFLHKKIWDIKSDK